MEETLGNVLMEISECLARPLVVENVLVLLEQDLEVKLTHKSICGKVFCICIGRNSISISYSRELLEPICFGVGNSEDSEGFEGFRVDSESSDYFRMPIPLNKSIHLINFTDQYTGLMSLLN